MKTASSALISLLATSDYVSADLWTITLNAGTIIRWTSADQPIKYGGNTFAKGPLIARGAISEKVGTEVATLDMNITALSTDLINGKPIIPFIAARGLDGASIKLEQAFAPGWPAMLTGSGPTGGIVRFAGKITSVNSIQGATANVTISSWMVLLNQSMPRNVYQAACAHTVYDAGCTLNAASFATNGSVSGSAGATISFATSLAPAANYYALGRIVFTSGANAGISRTIKANDSSGNFTLISPLPAGLAPGDGFTVYPGCDLTQATCLAKFNNLVNYKGEDFVPQPVTPVAIPSSSITTTSGKGGGE